MVFKISLDSIFALKLKREMIIRDGRLGLLRIIGIWGVIAYFILSKLYIDHSYLKTVPMRSSAEYVILDGERARPTELPYCKEYSGNAKGYFQHQCLATSPFTATQGSHTNLMFVATRLKDMAEYNASCLQEELFNGGPYETCINLSWEGEDFFLANAEKYRILFQHIASAGCDASGHCFPVFRSHDATGEMRCSNGDNMVIGEKMWKKHHYDEFTVQDLLKCAGADLDDALNEIDRRSNRHFGLALSLTINYENNYRGESTGYYYTVNVLPIRGKRVIPDPERAREVAGQDAYPRINPKYPVSHTEYELRHGISIQLQETGVQGRFDLSLFILASVEAVALLKAVDLVIVACMMYILPLRHIYKALIYDKSPRFSDYREGYPEAIASMNYLVNFSEALSRGTGLEETQTTAESVKENSIVDSASAVTVAELKSEVGSLLARCSLLEAAQAQCSERLSGLELERRENAPPDGLNKELLSQQQRETETLQEGLTQYASNSKPPVDMPPLPDITKECLHTCLADIEPRLQSVEQSVDRLMDKLAFDSDMIQKQQGLCTRFDLAEAGGSIGLNLNGTETVEAPNERTLSVRVQMEEVARSFSERLAKLEANVSVNNFLMSEYVVHPLKVSAMPLERPLKTVDVPDPEMIRKTYTPNSGGATDSTIYLDEKFTAGAIPKHGSSKTGRPLARNDGEVGV